MRQKTLDILDAALNKEKRRYKRMNTIDAYKLYEHGIRVYPFNWDSLIKEINKFPLNWHEIKYSDFVKNHKKGKTLDKQIPQNDIGIYCFYVASKNSILGMPKFILYVGIAGEGASNRPLRERLKEYFNFNTIKKRTNVHQMLKLYYEYVYISYSFFTGSYLDLEKLEVLLHEFWYPKFDLRDFAPETHKSKKAWGK